MAKIYKSTDRISIKIEDIEIKVSPLTLSQRMKLQKYFASGKMEEMMEGTVECLRFSLKGLKGVEDMEGNPFELEFEEGLLTHECAEDIFNMEHSQKLMAVCSSLLGGVPSGDSILDGNGNPMEGVKVLGKSKKRKASR